MFQWNGTSSSLFIWNFMVNENFPDNRLEMYKNYVTELF